MQPKPLLSSWGNPVDYKNGNPNTLSSGSGVQTQLVVHQQCRSLVVDPPLSTFALEQGIASPLCLQVLLQPWVPTQHDIASPHPGVPGHQKKASGGRTEGKERRCFFTRIVSGGGPCCSMGCALKTHSSWKVNWVNSWWEIQLFPYIQ